MLAPGTRVRMLDIGGQAIEGTVEGPGRTTQIRPLDPGHDDDISTVRVRWDEEFRGVDEVPEAALEVL